METEIQNLQKCYEDMKALYQLNTEKLDYNLKVLKEKHEENTHLYDELKRKDSNLSNRLRKLTKDYVEVKL
jgi:dynein regulatory complex protein 1